jgi:cation diffusion facilitator CzcD-associated flavoprotein CzcO
MTARTPEIAIVGAGMSGLLMGIQLQQAGFENFRIYEKADSIGGTWRENTYPGLACDVPSFFYSYSFETNLDWSSRFSPGSEILTYFERVAEKYGLLPHIRFGELVADARYEAGEDPAWSIETGSGEQHRADVLVLATGPLHKKNYPSIEGLDTFGGAQFHSAAWDHSVPLAGKRIGVIGTGSTGVQMTAPLADVADHLTIFQRTAQWIMPVGNPRYSEEQRRRKHRFPFLAKLTRWFYQAMYELSSVAVVRPGRLRQTIADRCRDHLATVEDEELRRKLTPDYEPACKRLVMSRDFYPALAKSNVSLETEAIERVEARGVVTRDGRLHELDVLVLATGFDAHAWGVDHVVGEDGRSLKQAWKDGVRSYRSIAMPGFPNLFMLAGPNSPIGNLSVIDIAETQSRYIVECVRRIERGQARALAPNPEATRAFHASLLAAMQDTVWVTGCSSWYLDDDGVPILWPWSARRFHKEMRRPNFGEWLEVGG